MGILWIVTAALAGALLGGTKMSELMNKVEAALKVSPRTQFRFENMEVLATRNDQTDYFTIGLKPH
jgi:hypothetical protein